MYDQLNALGANMHIGKLFQGFQQVNQSDSVSVSDECMDQVQEIANARATSSLAISIAYFSGKDVSKFIDYHSLVNLFIYATINIDQ